MFHAKIGAAVRLEHVKLFKAALVQQNLDSLTRCQFAFGMLRVDAALTSAQTSIRPAIMKFLNDIFHGWLLLKSKTP
jgi:hypothetical protein